MSGPGGIIMNARDAAVWLQTLLLGGANPATGEQVVPAEVIADISTGISVASPTKSVFMLLSSFVAKNVHSEPAVYGAGQQIGTYRGHGACQCL